MQSDLWVIGKRHYLSSYINAVQEREKTISDHKAMDAQTSSADDLTKTTAKGNVELTEEELVNVAGGVRKAGGTQLEYLKIKLDDIQVSS